MERYPARYFALNNGENIVNCKMAGDYRVTRYSFVVTGIELLAACCVSFPFC